jgi:hypothetical protein
MASVVRYNQRALEQFVRRERSQRASHHNLSVAQSSAAASTSTVGLRKMASEFLANHAKWKVMERKNTRAVRAKVRPMLRSLGFEQLTPSAYRMQLNGRTCTFGILKLRINCLRILGSVEGVREVLFSDPYAYKGHPSGFKFSLIVSRFGDNSEECAKQAVSFVTLVAVPWFHNHTN